MLERHVKDKVGFACGPTKLGLFPVRNLIDQSESGALCRWRQFAERRPLSDQPKVPHLLCSVRGTI
jgi:hypothetical protein